MDRIDSLKLSPGITDRLAGIPETGMGYHIVNLVLVDGRVLPNVVVVNGEFAILPEEFRDLKSDDILDVQSPEQKLIRRTQI